jgi:hypothetical protein
MVRLAKPEIEARPQLWPAQSFPVSSKANVSTNMCNDAYSQAQHFFKQLYSRSRYLMQFRRLGWRISAPAIMEVNTTLNATMNVDSHGQTATAFTIIVPALIAVIALVCLRFWPSGLDPKEPRLIPSNIPFIGHAIGMLRHQQRYFEILRYDFLGGHGSFRTASHPSFLQICL